MGPRDFKKKKGLIGIALVSWVRFRFIRGWNKENADGNSEIRNGKR